ncbi:hypothetical protein [Streptomyces sp. DH41]|uniref:hypothetical protein n=1 Tax=Streptomyces sp. DH41 TaxID=3040125 RepID=UPI002442467F|nr:hypothetical protein [Streptomyces sp. DH41]MDG9721812.1 hypothetical protein [Streptomyces sp. DH41]
MTASGPDSGATPDEPDGTPSVPEYVWRQFLDDDERAIRASAPREPAARDRTPGWRPLPPDSTDSTGGTDGTGSTGSTGTKTSAGRPSDVVGEPWHPEDPWTGPAWRELGGRARIRRVGRVIGTAAAVALALTAWSQLSTGTGTPGGGPADTIGRHLEESPVLPTAASLAPTASGEASPAVFEPAPSVIPRASYSSWTFD